MEDGLIRMILKPTKSKVGLAIILFLILSGLYIYYLVDPLDPSRNTLLWRFGITINIVPLLLIMIAGFGESYAIYPIQILWAYFLSCLIISAYEKPIGENNGNKRTCSILILVIVIIISIILIVLAILSSGPPKMSPLEPPGGLEAARMEAFRQHCNALCTRYADANFTEAKALEYCERRFEIDINKNGEIPGEAGMMEEYSVCENRVYCFNIKECRWGSSNRSHLTPEKCKDIMCDIYTKRFDGNNTAAEELIKSKMQFGDCMGDVPEDELHLIGWWQDNFKDVNCPIR